MADNNKTSKKALTMMDKMKEIFDKKLIAAETSKEKGKMKVVDQTTEDDATCTGLEGAPEGPEIYYPVDRFLEEIGASDVFASFGEALQSGNIEEFGHQLETEAFSGILVMLSVTHYIDNDPVFLLKFLKNYVMGSKCDVVGFSKEYGLSEAHQLTLLHALFNVMAIYQQAGEVDEPADMVAKAIVTGYESGVWDDNRIVRVLLYLLQSTDKGIKIIGLVTITALANLCKERTSSKTFSTVVIDESGFADSVIGKSVLNLSGDLKRRVMLCSKAVIDLIY